VPGTALSLRTHGASSVSALLHDPRIDGYPVDRPIGVPAKSGTVRKGIRDCHGLDGVAVDGDRSPLTPAMLDDRATGLADLLPPGAAPRRCSPSPSRGAPIRARMAEYLAIQALGEAGR
jgi:hypothetical protein